MQQQTVERQMIATAGAPIGIVPAVAPPGHDLLSTVLAELDIVAERLGLNPGIHAILRQPERELTVSVPVMMDDG